VPQRESSLRSTVLGALIELDAIAVENPALPGTPDINYVEGWIELKSICRWPRQQTTRAAVEHWTPQQKVWHIRRSRVGGQTYVLLEVVYERHCLLFEGAVAARILGLATADELRAAAIMCWPTRAAMTKDLLPLLRARRS
jgi:hypothetical protein